MVRALSPVLSILSRKKNRDKVSLSNTTRVGSYGDILESVQIGFGHKRVNSTTSLSTTHTDGWRNTTQEWDHHEVMNGTVTRTVNRSTNFTLRENLTYKVNDRLSLSTDGSFYQKWNYRPHGAFKYYTYDQFYRNFDVAGGAKYALGGLNFLSVDLLMVTIAISIITIIKMSRTSSIRRRVYVLLVIRGNIFWKPLNNVSLDKPKAYSTSGKTIS